MKYIVETKLPDYEDWYPVIDLDNSKVHPQIKKFATEAQATHWAESHSVKNHEWRVVEDGVQ